MQFRVAIVCIVTLLAACSQDQDPLNQALQAENQQLKQQLTQQGQQLMQQSQQLTQLIDQNKSLTTQLGAIQNQLGAMQKSTSVPSSVPADTNGPSAGADSTIAPSGANQKKLEPGWLVEVLPMKVDPEDRNKYVDAGAVSMGSFIGMPGRLNMVDHRKTVAGNNHVRYEASGFFTV